MYFSNRLRGLSLRVVTVMLLVCAVCACAMAVPQTPVALSAATDHDAVYRIVEPVTFKLSSAYTRTLKAGAEWHVAGQLPQGRVYRPRGDVFWIEGAHAHEAYLVVDGADLIGFYLPAERTFSALGHRIPVNLRKL
jgi:hypothetical protein